MPGALGERGHIESFRVVAQVSLAGHEPMTPARRSLENVMRPHPKNTSLRRPSQAKPDASAHKARRLIGYAIRLIAPCLIAIGAAAAHEYTSNGVTVAHPWARATPGGVRTAGAYLQVRATPGRGDRLIAARSPVAGAAELHAHSMEGGIAKMRRVDGIPIAGGSVVVLEPGAYHVMLMDLKQPLKEGDLLPLTLVFEKAGEISVDATVEPIGAMGPRGLDAQPGHAAESSGAHKH